MSHCDEKYSDCNTRYAGLALAVGWLKREKLFRFLNHLTLDLKTVKRTPRSKLEDLLVCVMAGVGSLRQIDESVRKDQGLALALGRESLADQSLISQTLDAFEEKSLAKLRSNLTGFLMQESRCIGRIYRFRETILDLDMTDLPCSKRCEGARKGRTTDKRGKTVRQLSLVYNHRYREPLDVFLHYGNVPSAGPLEQIVEYLEGCYGWDRPLRMQILWRLDAGYGSDRKLSWLMRRGYKVVAKGYSHQRAARLASQVEESDWKRVGPTQDVFEHRRLSSITSPHRCLLVRTQRSKIEGYRYSYVVSNLKKWVRPQTHIAFYNQRQGMEKEVQQIKSVLGLKHKRKRSFDGMQALALLTLIANLQLVWFRRELGVTELGIKRFIEEVLKIPGKVASSGSGIQITLEPQFKYYQLLNNWKPQSRLPLFPVQSGGMLYKI
jgi:hypothetical protein